ncbi:MAG: hypothetical protein ACOC2X_01185 [Bacillota bacterium]
MRDKQSYSDRKSSYEGKLIIGQTLMLLSVISLPFAFMIHLSLLILSALLLSMGVKLYFDAKEYLRKAREQFLEAEVKPRLKEEMAMDFHPDEGLPKDFFEGSQTLEIEAAYDSYQRFELKRSDLAIKGAYVRTGPKPSKFQSYQAEALFSGKVVHVVFEKAFRLPVTLRDDEAENAVPFGNLFAHGTNAEQFTAMAEEAQKTFDTFARKHSGAFRAVMRDNHLYLFIHDHRPFIDLSPAKPIGEPPIRFFKTFIEDVIDLSKSLSHNDSVMTTD